MRSPSGAAFVGENAGVSNPYAPPEDRPRTPDGDGRTRRPRRTGPRGRPRAHARAAAPVALEPERQPPDPEVAARAASLTRLFGVLVLASVLVATLPLPWQAPALLFAVAALVVGVRALVVAARARTRGLVPLLATGVVIALLVDALPRRAAGPPGPCCWRSRSASRAP